MPRAKKDGRFFNCYLDSAVLDRLEKYCADTGLTKTVAIERILTNFFNNNDKRNKNPEGAVSK